MRKSGQLWTRDEVLIAFNIYCRTPFGRLHARNPEIVAVARRMGRTPDALAMKCCNLASFDPAQERRGIKGLSKASRLDQEVWDAFTRDPEETGFESEARYAEAAGTALRSSETIEWEDVEGLDREAVVRVRVNQQLFRSIVLSGYDHECAVCRLPLPRLLVASHIVPWSVDKDQRMNPRNGLCLCTLHDKAFDTGLLRINSSYRIEFSDAIRDHSAEDSVRRHFLHYEGSPIKLPERWHPDLALLERHRVFTS